MSDAMITALASILIALSPLVASCASASTRDAAPPPANPPATAPDVVATPPDAPTTDAPLPPALDALLDELEASARDLHGFAADITYEKYDELLGTREIRSGEILYRVDPATDSKTFSVLFNSLVVNRRKSDRVKQYVFDGRWLAEIDHEHMQYIKRELVPPGKSLDPLKLGEGPIPLPIGQAKADVLARFEVGQASVPTDGMLSRLDAADVDGIRLIPKPGTPEAHDFKQVDIFYDKATRLPVGIEAIEDNDDRKTVWLRNVKRNPEFTPEMLAQFVLVNPDPTKWKIDIQPWQGQP